MAKKTKETKAKKNRLYTIQSDVNHVPFLNIRGKFLEKIGVEVGSRWEMIESEDMLILKKMPQAISEYNDTLK